jgi:hypothetical protein
MPIYESICLTCGKYHEYVRAVSQCLDTPECCGTKTDKRILTKPMAAMDMQPWEAFESPATGKIITSKKERADDMRASGCRDWEGMDSEKRHAERQKQYQEAEADKKLDHAVRSAWAELSPSKKAAALAAM